MTYRWYPDVTLPQPRRASRSERPRARRRTARRTVRAVALASVATVAAGAAVTATGTPADARPSHRAVWSDSGTIGQLPGAVGVAKRADHGLAGLFEQALLPPAHGVAPAAHPGGS